MVARLMTRLFGPKVRFEINNGFSWVELSPATRDRKRTQFRIDLAKVNGLLYRTSEVD